MINIRFRLFGRWKSAKISYETTWIHIACHISSIAIYSTSVIGCLAALFGSAILQSEEHDYPKDSSESISMKTSESLGTTINTKPKPCKATLCDTHSPTTYQYDPNIIDPASTCPGPLYSCLNPLPLRHNRYIEPPIRGLQHQLLMPPCFEKIAHRPDQDKPPYDHQNVRKPVTARYT